MTRRYALNGARFDAARNKTTEEPKRLKCIVVGPRKISGKEKGEEVELPEDQARRLIAVGLVAEKPRPAAKSFVAEKESAATHGPSVPKSRKG